MPRVEQSWKDELNYVAQSNYPLYLALLQAEGDDGNVVSLSAKKKYLRKWGRNPDVDTGAVEMIWRAGGLEVLPSGNTINRAVSTSVGDTGDIVVEGHTVDGSGNLTFVVQTVTLTGTTPVTLSTPLARGTRLYNAGSTDFSGNITVDESGNSNVHIFADATFSPPPNQSEKCATSISQTDYWFITDFWADVKRATSATVDMFVQVRELNGVFRTLHERTVSTTGSSASQVLSAPIIVKPNSDVRVLCLTTANNTSVSAGLGGPLGSIIG